MCACAARPRLYSQPRVAASQLTGSCAFGPLRHSSFQFHIIVSRHCWGFAADQHLESPVQIRPGARRLRLGPGPAQNVSDLKSRRQEGLRNCCRRGQRREMPSNYEEFGQGEPASPRDAEALNTGDAALCLSQPTSSQPTHASSVIKARTLTFRCIEPCP